MKKIDDRSALAEELLCELWEKKYFCELKLRTIAGETVTIVSTGEHNFDAGPDFKNATIRLDEQIISGDVEIHRAPEDWYQHKHHADPAYNKVVLHLIIGVQTDFEPAVRLDRRPMPAEVFVDIPESRFPELIRKYQLHYLLKTNDQSCRLSQMKTDDIIAVIDQFARQRLIAKAERFKEQHQWCSWNQVLYQGLMEALGYSKNQTPFRKLAQIIPVEALIRECCSLPSYQRLHRLQGILFGAAGLLPSQNPSVDWRKIEDAEIRNYIQMLESIWQEFYDRIGIQPLQRAEWLFFRLRPANFPTRRLAGVSQILLRFSEAGFLEKLLNIFNGLKDNHTALVRELERMFVCKTTNYWAYHFLLSDNERFDRNKKTETLVGENRARDIVVNIALPVILAYADETEDAQLKALVLQLYQSYPRATSNFIVKKMNDLFFSKPTAAPIGHSGAMRQQGMTHIYKLYCRKKECDRCQNEWKQLFD